MECTKIIDPSKKVIIFLCEEKEITRERKAYLQAFRGNFNVLCCIEKELNKVISDIEKQGEIFFILYPDPCEAAIPENILQLNYPTACFQIDTYDGTEGRMKQSMLFDHAFLFHPGYDKMLAVRGHSGACLVPHAVETNLYPSFNETREFEVGWVGRLDGPFYKNRKTQVEAIQEHFKTNDITRFYSQDELITVYSNSKIAVNISRDDYMIDANLRCFEILAAGALLITKEPTELKDLGLVDGEHFVSYQHTEDLIQKIDYYLKNDQQRRKIAYNGFQVVRKEHDFLHRAEKIIEVVKGNSGRKMAPARNWNALEIQEVFFDHYSHRRKFTKAVRYGCMLLKSRYQSSFYVLKNLGKIIFLNMKFYTK